MDNAVTLAPDEPMYLMLYGYTTYEGIVAAAREDEARKTNSDPKLVTPDLTKLDFSKALPPLLRAVQLEPKLWRAHYYIGRIYRDGGFASAAAASFRESIGNGASSNGPFIALVELYRKWGFSKPASEVALIGSARFTGPEAADVWYVLGMSYDDLRDDKLAVQAFTQSLAARPDNAKALFQRGQVYARLKDKTHAKADLEAFVKLAANDGRFTFALQHASKLLLDLGGR
jgi:tetratricopeptide (TPR) repeat protein